MSHTTLRNRHDRIESHSGLLWATLVELSSALDVDLPAGMLLEEAIAIINARVTRLENLVRGHIVADAVVLCAMPGSLSADAISRAFMTGSLAAAAISMRVATASFVADAVALRSQAVSFSAHAEISL